MSAAESQREKHTEEEKIMSHFVNEGVPVYVHTKLN